MSIDFSSKEMQRLVQIIGKPIFEGEQVYLRISRVANRLGIEPASAKSYWYDERKPDPKDFIAAKQLCGEPIEEAPGHDFSKLQKQVIELERQYHEARKDIDRLMSAVQRERNARKRAQDDLFGAAHSPLA